MFSAYKKNAKNAYNNDKCGRMKAAFLERRKLIEETGKSSRANLKMADMRG